MVVVYIAIGDGGLRCRIRMPGDNQNLGSRDWKRREEVGKLVGEVISHASMAVSNTRVKWTLTRIVLAGVVN